MCLVFSHGLIENIYMHRYEGDLTKHDMTRVMSIHYSVQCQRVHDNCPITFTYAFQLLD